METQSFKPLAVGLWQRGLVKDGRNHPRTYKMVCNAQDGLFCMLRHCLKDMPDIFYIKTVNISFRPKGKEESQGGKVEYFFSYSFK